MNRHGVPQVTADDVEAAVHSWMADQTMRDLADYLTRGRGLESLPVPGLTARWVSRVRLWADAPSIYGRDTERNDLQAEFKLRGLELPGHLVEEELRRIVEAADKAMCSMSEDAKDRLNEDVMGFRAQEIERRN